LALRAGEVRRVSLKAFAKINLSLKVLHKRPDGFHEIRSLFETISLADRIGLEVSRSTGREVAVESTVEIAGENLASRAARAILDETGAKAKVTIRLDKRIPMGGGLGGGSTDAAAMLLALPVLLEKPIPLPRLEAIGASLGSDIPFFLHGGLALVLGRGQELYPLRDLPVRQGVLFAPGLHVSTPQAYRDLQRPELASLTESVSDAIIERFRELTRRVQRGEPQGHWASLCENDFEAVVFRQYPRLKSVLGTLARSGASPARMSGSGSTLFGYYDTPQAAHAAWEGFQSATSGHVTASGGKATSFRSIGRRQYERAWQRMLLPFADGSSWPPRHRSSASVQV
jgi:4-diphosphocytidyl-2-C-methyl-D-erythritol kinase